MRKIRVRHSVIMNAQDWNKVAFASGEEFIYILKNDSCFWLSIIYFHGLCALRNSYVTYSCFWLSIIYFHRLCALRNSYVTFVLS